MTFDTVDRLTDISHVLGGVTTVSSFGYGHNAVNQRTSLTQTRPSVTVTAALTYGYDDLDRLTLATNPQVAAPDETFGYDPVGNRLNRDGQVVDSTFDAATRLIEDQQFCYAYDLNGNLASKTVKVAGACTGGVTTYIFDVENRLVRIDFPGGGFADYRYDGLGRRIEKDFNGTVTRYVYDGSDILLEYDGTNFLVARYTHGPGIDDPVMLERDIDSSGTFELTEAFFYQTDGLGSVTELTDSTGAVARTLVYDSYGRIAQDTGGIVQPFAFTGRELDAESGLYFYRARYYDAGTGRFLAEDPLGFVAGDVNLYRYVLNNPINLNDPDGQIFFNPVSAVFGGISGGVGAFIASGGDIGATAIGALAGGLVGGVLQTPFAGNFVASVVGQGIGNLFNPCKDIDDIDLAAAIGAGLGGKIGNSIGGLIKNKIINTLGGNNLAQNLAGGAGAVVEGVFVGGGEAAGANYISPAF